MNRHVILIILQAVNLLFACGARQESKPRIQNPEQALIEKLGDFSRASEIRIYSRDDLWKYNNGASERFLELGFEKLATADYLADSLEATVEIYAFAAPSGAAAIYEDNVSPDERVVDIGDNGFVSEGLLLFYKNNVFVQITCYNPDPLDAALIRLARLIESNLKFGD